jgi:putative aldouronate transport system substrate-binding protein
MNDLYRNGVIKAETFAYQNEDQATSMATSGKAFAYAWTTAAADRLNAMTAESGMRWDQFPIALSEDFAHVRRDLGWQGVFITKNNKNPEASIKLMQFLLSDEGQQLAMWGIEGEHWNWSEDGGYPVFTYDRNSDEVKNEMGVYWWGLLGGSAVTELLGNYIPGTIQTRSSQELMAHTTFEPDVGLVQPAPDSREQIMQTNIDNLIKNEEAKVLMATSEEEAREAYNNMLKQAEKIGLADLEAWANEKYAEVKKNFE